jgi:beta-glucosidase/6-phospho-beta-glucosidase/beta-galactosidase
MPCLSFPPDFLSGNATAAHQLEGQNQNNDWRTGRYREDFDRATQARAKKSVADIYARIICENGIAGDLMERYGRAN